MKHPKTTLIIAEAIWLILIALLCALIISCKATEKTTSETNRSSAYLTLRSLLQTLTLQDTTRLYFLPYPNINPAPLLRPGQTPDAMPTPSQSAPAMMSVRSLSLRAIERDTTQQTKAETTQATSQTETERKATTTTSHTTTIITIVLILALLVFLWLQRRRLIHRGYI